MPLSDPDPPSGQLLLNFDVLRVVCDYLSDVSDILSFALTCSALTEDAMRRRLSMSPVNLLSAESVNRFYSFIFANKAARAPYIYGLKISSPHYHRSQVQVLDQPESQIIDNHLVALLEAAVHIQYLYFPAFVTPVFNAAMERTTLRELYVDCGRYSGPLRIHFTTLRSPLRSICIVGPGPSEDNLSANFLHTHLSHFAPTLEALDSLYFELDIHPSSIVTPFAAVRSLKFKADFIFGLDGLAALLRLFPNLNTLVLDLYELRFDDGMYQTFRRHNEEVQATHTWSRLDRLVCDPEIAFSMALRCPIRRMDVGITWPDIKQYLTNALRHNSPQHLHLSLIFHRGLDVLDGLLPLEMVDKLTHLSIFAEFEVYHKWKRHSKQKRVSWDRFFNRIIDSVKHLRLTHIRVVLHCTAHQVPPTNFKGEIMNTASEADLHPIACRFIDAIPTLDYLFLATCGYGYTVTVSAGGERFFRHQEPFVWHLSKAWRAVTVHGGDKPASSNATPASSCMELSSETACRVMNREDLHFSRDEEDEIRRCTEWMD